MDRERGPCLECRADVPAQATTCPACGYAVEGHDWTRLWLGAAGMVLTLSLVLAPVGLPLLWRAHCHRAAVAGTVTRRDEEGVRAHLGDVLRRHLGYRYAVSGGLGGELRRGGSAPGREAVDVAHEPP